VTTLGDVLGRWLGAELPPGTTIEISGLRRTSAGFSRENWVFDLEWSRPPERGLDRLIARRDPPGSVLETDRQTEFDVLRALEATSVPAPRARWIDADGRRLERPTIVMVREEGECDWFVLNGTRPLPVRVGIARQLCDLLVSIHRVDWRAIGLGAVFDDPGGDASLVELDRWERVLRTHQLEPLPELELVFAWLRQRAPKAGATVLVHADFKPGNTLLRGDEVAVMLDWELAHLGDPLEDLGWVTNPLRRREHIIPGAWEIDDLVAHYEKATGSTVDRQALRWWNVFSNLKLSIIVLTGLAAYVDGRYDRSYQLPCSLFSLMLDLMEV
jgi:aminoglycoside phosphotransferase (APT) family kinase protein